MPEYYVYAEAILSVNAISKKEALEIAKNAECGKWDIDIQDALIADPHKQR